MVERGCTVKYVGNILTTATCNSLTVYPQEEEKLLEAVRKGVIHHPLEFGYRVQSEVQRCCTTRPTHPIEAQELIEKIKEVLWTLGKQFERTSRHQCLTIKFFLRLNDAGGWSKGLSDLTVHPFTALWLPFVHKGEHCTSWNWRATQERVFRQAASSRRMHLLPWTT